MFERLKTWMKGGMQRMAANTGMAREFKDIFEIGGVPAFNQFYYFGIFIWKYLYRGFYNVWHLVPGPTIKDPLRKREMFRTDMAKAVSAELASLIWSEACQVNVSRRGLLQTPEEQEDKLGRFVRTVLKENNFSGKMQEHIEQSMALGGGTLKVWFEPKRGADGKPVEGRGRIRIGYGMADQFVPTAWDNAGVSQGVFVSRLAKDGYYYTRLEWHSWDGDTYIITNELYRSAMRKPGANESQDILGYRYPLNAIYPTLDERTELHGVEKSFFSYYRTAVANNLDDNSPLGVSIYANAMSTLHALDICYDSLVSEFRLGRKRIIVPARAIRTVPDHNGNMVRYFDATDEVYEALATDDATDLKIQDNSVELRVEEHVRALNALLAILCLQTGLSASTFTFDLSTGLKTATEVVSENSKTYKTVKTNQAQVQVAIERLIENIIAVAVLYGVDFEGETVESLVSDGYDMQIKFDDSIIQDRQTDLNEGAMLVNSQLMSKFRFMTEKLGLTKEQAEAEITRIREEGSFGPDVIDNLDSFGA